MGNLRDKYCIVGIGQTTFSDNSGRTTRAMAVEAVQKAMADAGLKAVEVDGLLCYHQGDSTTSPAVATDLGLRPNFYMDCSGGGSSTEALIGLAMGAIEGGMCNAVAIYRAMNGRSGVRRGGSGPLAAAPVSGPMVWGRLSGWSSPAQMFAFTFVRHMMEYGTTNEQLAAVKVAHSKAASNNPKAFMKSRATIEDVLNSRWIVEPCCHLMDCCLETDNAVALIVTPVERARNLRQRPVYIMGAAGRVCKPRPMMNYQHGPITTTAGVYAAPRLFASAGITPEDVDITGSYDAFTFTTLIQLEDYGLCKKGEGGHYCASGAIALGGRRPNNTSGGQLCEGYSHGISLVVENVRQLRGMADDYCPRWQEGIHTYDYSEGKCRQVRDPEISLNIGWAGAQTTSGMLLRR